MVTFTLPEELRGLFFGMDAKQAYHMLFDAVSTALSGAMERNKQLRASKSGFTMVLNTWNQQMMFHPHVHIIVPGAGLDTAGNYRQVKSAQFLVAVAVLKTAYRKRFRELMEQHGWQSDPAVWGKSWAVNVQAFGSGTNAIKYLGAYVGRSVIGDRRSVAISPTSPAYFHVLATRMRNRMMKVIQREHPELKRSLPATAWRKRWNVQIQPVGKGYTPWATLPAMCRKAPSTPTASFIQMRTASPSAGPTARVAATKHRNSLVTNFYTASSSTSCPPD